MLIFMLSFDILLFSIIHSTMEKQISCVVHWEGERNVLNYITLSLTSSMCVWGGGKGGRGEGGEMKQKCVFRSKEIVSESSSDYTSTYKNAKYIHQLIYHNEN